MMLFPQLAQLTSLLRLLVGIEPGFLEFVVRDGSIHAPHDELKPFLRFQNLFRRGRLPKFHPRSYGINQFQSLAGKRVIRKMRSAE